MKTVLPLFVVLCLSTVVLHAQYTWESVGPNLGTPPLRLEYSSHGFVFAFDDTYLYRSSDEGTTWKQLYLLPEMVSIPGGNWHALLTVSRNGDLYWGSTRGIARSTDDGSTWTLLPSAPDSVGAMTILDDGRIVASRLIGANLYVSSNSGTDWKKIDISDTDYSQAIVLDSIGNIFLLSSPQMYKISSKDFSYEKINYPTATSEPFIRLNFSTKSSVILYILDSPNSFFGYYRTKDGGKSWTKLDSVSINAVQANGTLFGNKGTDIVISTDEGDTWTVLCPNNHNLHDYNILPSGHIIGVSDKEMLRSDDLGKTWINARGQISTTSVLGMQFSDSGILYAVDPSSIQGVFASGDYGKTWEKVGNFPTSYDAYSLFLKFKISGTGNMYYAVGDPFSWGYARNLFRSTNGGHSWSPLCDSLPFNSVNDFGFVGNDLFICTGSYDQNAVPSGALYVSSDTGNTWKQVTSGLNNGPYSAFYKSQSNKLFLGSMEYTLYSSTDNGANWKVLYTFPNGVLAVTQDKNNTLYASIQQFGVFVSTDDGITWNEMNAGIDPADISEFWGSSFLTTDSGDLYYVSNSGLVSPFIYKLSSHASSWTKLSAGNSVPVACLAIDKVGRLYSGTRGNGIFRTTSSVVSVEEDYTNVSQSLARCYPNPARDVVVVECNAPKRENVQFRILNSLGECVSMVSCSVNANNTAVIPCKNLPEGVYCLVSDDEQIRTRLIIVR